MIISEKQILQLIRIALDYSSKVRELIDKGLAHGEAAHCADVAANLVGEINAQQSIELKDVK